MIQNEIYERDYAEERAQRIANEPRIYSEAFNQAVEGGFFKAYNDAMRAMPKYIVPKDKATYEDLLPRLDAVAKRWGGKIKGVIDYEHWDSHIDVELPFFECSSPEEYALLADIAAKTNLVTFSATEDGKIRLHIMINYFDEIGDKENLIEETIMQDDKLVELLERQHEEEKKFALSDPKISAFLDELGTNMGMSGEELYDMIDRMCQTDPEWVNKMLTGQDDADEEEDEE